MRSIELFTGTGGLALGLAKAGFEHALAADWDRHACATLNSNATRVPEMRDWEILEVDVRSLDYSPYAGGVALLAAGAPCQPFSLGGKHRGDEDRRNMFPEVFRATAQLMPAAVVIENVRGLLRPSFRPYFEYIKLRLAMPERNPGDGVGWREHLGALSDAADAPGAGELRYHVSHDLIDVADFGVPQNRHRVVIVAFRADIGQPPPLTRSHSQDSLLYAQYVDGSYWREYDIPQPEVPQRFHSRVQRLRSFPRPPELRWRTVRDALKGLPQPTDFKEDPYFANHVGVPGARAYLGHTGSQWDRPAKALKAGVHGVPGGENMLQEPSGVRYFTVREAARLQTFPDAYRFSGPWGECMRQLGNAVPVKFAEEIGSIVAKAMSTAFARTAAEEQLGFVTSGVDDALAQIACQAGSSG